jgi:hypothetical protein
VNILTWWKELREGLEKCSELKAVEHRKIKELAEADNLDAATMCLDSITANVKRDTDKAKKKGERV